MSPCWASHSEKPWKKTCGWCSGNVSHYASILHKQMEVILRLKGENSSARTSCLCSNALHCAFFHSPKHRWSPSATKCHLSWNQGPVSPFKNWCSTLGNHMQRIINGQPTSEICFVFPKQTVLLCRQTFLPGLCFHFSSWETTGEVFLGFKKLQQLLTETLPIA